MSHSDFFCIFIIQGFHQIPIMFGLAQDHIIRKACIIILLDNYKLIYTSLLTIKHSSYISANHMFQGNLFISTGQVIVEGVSHTVGQALFVGSRLDLP